MSDTPAVHAYARDAATAGALAAGLAGLEARVLRLPFAGALARIAADPAPAVLFADLDGSPDPPAESVRRLLGLLHPATRLVVLLGRATAATVLQCSSAGAADTLPKPLSPALVREAAATLLPPPEAAPRGPPSRHAGRVVACAGTAGLGLSTLVLSTALLLARAGRSVLCLDLDPVAARACALTGTAPGLALDATLFRLEAELQAQDEAAGPDADPAPGADPDAPYRPLLTDVDARLAVPVRPGLGLVAYPPPSGLVEEPPTARSVQRLMDGLGNHAQTVFVLGLAEPDLLVPALEAADARVLAYEPTLASIAFTTHLCSILSDPPQTTFVECRARSPRPQLGAAEVRRALAGREPAVTVPYVASLARGPDGRHPFPSSPGKPYLRAVGALVSHALGAPVAVP